MYFFCIQIEENPQYLYNPLSVYILKLFLLIIDVLYSHNGQPDITFIRNDNDNKYI